MRKEIFIVVCLAAPVLAYGQNGNSANSGMEVNLLGPFEHTGTVGNTPPKSPVEPPYVTLDDHTIYIWSQHNGYSLTLLDDNETVVYQSYVAPGVQYAVLPSTLSGSYTLVLSDDTYMFTGMIDLE